MVVVGGFGSCTDECSVGAELWVEHRLWALSWGSLWLEYDRCVSVAPCGVVGGWWCGNGCGGRSGVGCDTLLGPEGSGPDSASAHVCVCGGGLGSGFSGCDGALVVSIPLRACLVCGVWVGLVGAVAGVAVRFLRTTQWTRASLWLLSF